ncbi:DUF2517 family protein [Photobacterium atrarenae]|uniref:YbfA family protein n=1 Tax=Photobacterium atrarenae TaxID=865757 RepID=A0ABY5GH94_9GAMM|nr:DUF2517 family protein [Photobacterium atrarenae]UTV28500.1 YbfA family protein [Photobacterium atrarenae]
MYQPYSLLRILLRRVGVVLIGMLALPLMLLLPKPKRAAFYSLMHRFWTKTSTKPVWLKESEHGAQQLY